MLRRTLVSLAVLAAAAFVALVAPTRTTAVALHGDCSQGEAIEHRTTVYSQYNLPYTSKVHGYIRFACDGSQSHAKTFVHVRIYKCKRLTSWCDGPLTFVAGVSKYCYRTWYCIRQTGWIACQRGYKFIAYGRWRAWSSNGTVVHQNPAWPNFNQEKPLPLSGFLGTNC
jgi:hypothetical protein